MRSFIYDLLKDEPEENPATSFMDRMRKTRTITNMKGLFDMFTGIALGFMLCFVLLVL